MAIRFLVFLCFLITSPITKGSDSANFLKIYDALTDKDCEKAAGNFLFSLSRPTQDPLWPLLGVTKVPDDGLNPSEVLETKFFLAQRIENADIISGQTIVPNDDPNSSIFAQEHTLFTIKNHSIMQKIIKCKVLTPYIEDRTLISWTVAVDMAIREKASTLKVRKPPFKLVVQYAPWYKINGAIAKKALSHLPK